MVKFILKKTEKYLQYLIEYIKENEFINPRVVANKYLMEKGHKENIEDVKGYIEARTGTLRNFLKHAVDKGTMEKLGTGLWRKKDNTLECLESLHTIEIKGSHTVRDRRDRNKKILEFMRDFLSQNTYYNSRNIARGYRDKYIHEFNNSKGKDLLNHVVVVIAGYQGEFTERGLTEKAGCRLFKSNPEVIQAIDDYLNGELEKKKVVPNYKLRKRMQEIERGIKTLDDQISFLDISKPDPESYAHFKRLWNEVEEEIKSKKRISPIPLAQSAKLTGKISL